MKKYKTPIPTVNKRYNFYDDGKISFARHHIAEVLRILTIEEAQNIQIKYYDDEEYWSLYDIYKHTCDEYDYLKLHDEDTDVFVECIIPGFDYEKVYFARSLDGGFFSFDTTGSWMSGRLDVDGERTRNLYNDYCDDWDYKDAIEELLLD
jgi:hypothetical protein